MPQLSIETFVTQYFWLVIFLFTNYILSATIYLPRFAEILKLRKKLESSDSLISENKSLLASQQILSQVLQKFNYTNSANKYDLVFVQVNNNWADSYIKSK